VEDFKLKNNIFHFSTHHSGRRVAAGRRSIRALGLEGLDCFSLGWDRIFPHIPCKVTLLGGKLYNLKGEVSILPCSLGGRPFWIQYDPQLLQFWSKTGQPGQSNTHFGQTDLNLK